MKPVSKFQARYGTTVGVGGLTMTALLVLDRALHVLSVADLAISDGGVRGALFGAMISVCGLFLTVWLAILAVVTSLADDKPVVRLMKNELGNYDELIHRLVGPVWVVLVVALASVVCILLPGAKPGTEGHDMGWVRTILPSATIALMLGLFVQTAGVARLLAKVLLFKPRKPSDADSPDAARARMENRRAKVPPAPNDSGAAAVAMAR